MSGSASPLSRDTGSPSTPAAQPAELAQKDCPACAVETRHPFPNLETVDNRCTKLRLPMKACRYLLHSLASKCECLSVRGSRQHLAHRRANSQKCWKCWKRTDRSISRTTPRECSYSAIGCGQSQAATPRERRKPRRGIPAGASRKGSDACVSRRSGSSRGLRPFRP